MATLTNETSRQLQRAGAEWRENRDPKARTAAERSAGLAFVLLLALQRSGPRPGWQPRRPAAVMACDFSQRQGHVSIARGDGLLHDLTPGQALSRLSG